MAVIDDHLHYLREEINNLESSNCDVLSRAEALKIFRLLLNALDEIRAIIDENTY